MLNTSQHERRNYWTISQKVRNESHGTMIVFTNVLVKIYNEITNRLDTLGFIPSPLVKYAHMSQFVYKDQAQVLCMCTVQRSQSQNTGTEKILTRLQETSLRRMKPNKSKALVT